MSCDGRDMANLGVGVMMAYLPYLWFIAGAVFIIAEVITPGFVLLWFGIGAVVAGLLAWLQIGLGIQITAFLGVSILLTIASRTIFEKLFMRDASGRRLRTGIESLPGQIGTVVQASHGARHEAAVKVYGSTWTAYPAHDEEPLDEGEHVEVERVEGTVLYVRRRSSRLPWRPGSLQDRI